MGRGRYSVGDRAEEAGLYSALHVCVVEAHFVNTFVVL